MRPLLTVVSLLGLSLAVAAEDIPPRAILEKGIIVQGGERLAKARTLVRSAKGELEAFPKPISMVGEAQFNLPEQARWNFELEQNKQKSLITLAINKTKGWRSSGGAVQDLTARELANLQEDAYVYWVMTLLPLLQNTFELSALPETKVNGVPAIGFKVASKGRPDVALYFDKKTGLLAKAEYKGREADLPVNKEVIVSEYKDFDGLRLATRYLEQANGKRVAEWTVTGYKFPERVDEAVFNKP
jgi:hypothetical protein